ncbi:hypothetical protein NWO25_03860 [Enterococcus lactis]|nr:hypothetical protein [Enterococcus lactis]
MKDRESKGKYDGYITSINVKQIPQKLWIGIKEITEESFTITHGVEIKSGS